MKFSDVIPPGWARVKLSQTCHIEMGQSPPSSTYNTDGDGLPFFQGKAEFTDLYPVVEKWCSRPQKIAEPNNILLSVRAPVGPTNLAETKCCIGRGLTALSPYPGIEYRYIWYMMRYVADDLASQATGSTFGAVTRKVVDEFPILIAPSNEQRRIVAKIEELFSYLDAGVASLKRVKANLTRYRASVLKAAVEGKLTEQWRRDNPSTEPASKLLERILAERRKRWEQDQLAKYEAKGQKPPSGWKEKYKEPSKPDTANLPDLPKGWVWATAEQLCQFEINAIKAGPFGSSLKKSSYVESGYKIYGQEQVLRNDPWYGDYYIDKAKYLSLESCSVKPGDLLISLVGTIGRTLILPDGIEKGIINPRLIKISLNNDFVLPDYIQLYFQSSKVAQIFKLLSHGGTMEILNMATLKAIAFPIPPPIEQIIILEAAQQALSVIDNFAISLPDCLSKIGSLRQAVLKQAFEGRLVPQDIKDEPASVLFERIKHNKLRMLTSQFQEKPLLPKR